MPHIVISCIEQKHIQAKANELIDTLSEALDTPKGAFVLELNTNINLINPQPVCLVKWLPRPHLHETAAKIINDILEVNNLQIIFQDYDKSMFYINGTLKK